MLIAALLLLQITAAPSAQEEPVPTYTQSNTNAGAVQFANDRLWKAFHGAPGVARIVDDLISRSQIDSRISDIFRNRDMVRLRRTLNEQLCYILGGGCSYTGRDMTAAHKDMGIQQADMAALVENLQMAMRQERIPFAAQNRLLAKLAPMHRDIVTR